MGIPADCFYEFPANYTWYLQSCSLSADMNTQEGNATSGSALGRIQPWIKGFWLFGGKAAQSKP